MLMAMVPRAVKARRFTAMCATFLALGLILFLFVHPTTQAGLNALHGVVGVCLGMSGAFGAVAVKLRMRSNGRD
jgi:succinate-acetate transporter protein